MSQVYQPRSLGQGLSIQTVGEETLIYDERVHRAFCLNLVSSAVWAHCDGTQSVGEIAAALCRELNQPVTDETVLLALAQMEENGLLDPGTKSPSEASVVAHGSISRRSLVATLGAGAMMLLPGPAIAAVMAPKPFAGSGCTDCSFGPSPSDAGLPVVHRFRRPARPSGEGQ
jgi:hypothetical protein